MKLLERPLLVLVIVVVCAAALGLVADRGLDDPGLSQLLLERQPTLPEPEPAYVSMAKTAPTDLLGRQDHTAVWTTDSMLVWGGVWRSEHDGYGRAEDHLDDGAAYRPATRTWQFLPAAPLAGRTEHVSVWTGTEMIVWGGRNATGSLVDGAAYDPVQRSWRTIAAAPLDGTVSTSVWTGEDLVVAVMMGDVPVTMAYRASTDTWNVLPEVPRPEKLEDRFWLSDAAWVAGIAYFKVVPDVGRGDLRDRTPIAPIIGFDPTRDEWIAVADFTLPRTEVTTTRLVSAGASLLILTNGVHDCWIEARNLAYDPTHRTYEYVEPPPEQLREISSSVWTGDDVVFWAEGDPVLYDVGADRWTTFGPVRGAVDGKQTIVWTGDTVIAWGGSQLANASSAVTRDGFVFHPRSAVQTIKRAPVTCVPI